MPEDTCPTPASWAYKTLRGRWLAFLAVHPIGGLYDLHKYIAELPISSRERGRIFLHCVIHYLR